MPQTGWERDELIQRIREIFDEYNLWDEGVDAYDKLKIKNKPARVTIKQHFGVGSWRKIKDMLVEPETIPEKIKPYPQVEKQEQTPVTLLTSRLYAVEKALKKQRNITAIIIDTVQAGLAKMNMPIAKPPPAVKSPDNLSFHAMRSDDQVGEVVDADMTQGLGNYNADVFRKRLDRWTERILTFREQDRRSLGLNKLVIHVLGDMVEGETIYRGQAFAIDLPLVDQLFTALESNVQSILMLAQAFPEVEIFCVPGNHGRPGRKGDNHPKTNFDYILYRSLQNQLVNQPNVKVYVSDSPTMIVRHGAYNFALNHMDDVKSWMGLPFYGVNRKCQRLDGLYGMTIHYKLGGHFHTAANLHDEILLNGTMVGGSDLSINKMHETSQPSQEIFYFHDQHGINRKTTLKLDTRPVLVADENNIYTAYV